MIKELAEKDEEKHVLRERLCTLEGEVHDTVLPERAGEGIAVSHVDRDVTTVSLIEQKDKGTHGGAVVPVSDPGCDPTHLPHSPTV